MATFQVARKAHTARRRGGPGNRELCRLALQPACCLREVVSLGTKAAMKHSSAALE